MTTEQQYIESLDIEASYNLAKKMEAYRTNPVLGYRPAGSWAEFETGEMLKAYMEDLGLSNVRKDEIKVDGWEFKRAVLASRDAAGSPAGSIPDGFCDRRRRNISGCLRG